MEAFTEVERDVVSLNESAERVDRPGGSFNGFSLDMDRGCVNTCVAGTDGVGGAV